MKKKSKFDLHLFVILFLVPTISALAISDRSLLAWKSSDAHGGEEKIGGANQKDLESLATALTVLEKMYVNPNAVKSDVLINKAIKGMITDLDPYTVYLDSSQFSNFSSHFTIDSTEENIKFAEISNGYGYARIAFFQKSVAFQLYGKIKEYETKKGKKLKGLVLDLRDNPGGLLEEALRLSDLFLNNQLIVSIEGRDKQNVQQIKSSAGSGVLNYFPLVVLVNKGTASSSEIVAGALQDSQRAVIMGSETYGKNTIQDIIPLPNGGAIKVTTAHYIIPHSHSQGNGSKIIPDLKLDDTQQDSALFGKSEEKAHEVQIAYMELTKIVDKTKP